MGPGWACISPPIDFSLGLGLERYHGPIARARKATQPYLCRCHFNSYESTPKWTASLPAQLQNSTEGSEVNYGLLGYIEGEVRYTWEPKMLNAMCGLRNRAGFNLIDKTKIGARPCSSNTSMIYSPILPSMPASAGPPVFPSSMLITGP